MTRPTDRESVSLRVSITDRCQLRCAYCMPPEGVDKRARGDVLSFEEIVRFVHILTAGVGLRKVHITGGEPLLRAGVVDLVMMLTAEGVADLALTTNGQQLAAMAGELKHAGLGRVNVSLDTLRPRRYAEITRGGELSRTLEGIREARRCGFAPVKLNTVVMKGVNDDELADIVRFGLTEGCEVRFLELMPIGPAAEFNDRFVPSADVLTRLREAFEIVPIASKPGGSSRRYGVRDDRGVEGVIGLISSLSRPFCAGCRRLRLTSLGQLIGCLAVGEGADVRAHLQADRAAEVLQAVGRTLRLKRTGPDFANNALIARIGGWRRWHRFVTCVT